MNLQKIKTHLAFTLVELVVVATILAILATIGFSSFSTNIPDARDSQRKADFSKIKAAMIEYKNYGPFPFPGDYVTHENTSGTGVVYQGKLNNKVTLSNMDSLPTDPETELPYMYSTTLNRQEFQIAGTLENADNPIAITIGNYKTVSKNILPTIVLATKTAVDVSTSTGSQLFIFDGGNHNLPYTFDEPYDPSSDGSDLNTLLNDTNINFWQNSDYKTCSEINLAAKSIGNGEYQILSSTGALTNTGCTF